MSASIAEVEEGGLVLLQPHDARGVLQVFEAEAIACRAHRRDADLCEARPSAHGERLPDLRPADVGPLGDISRPDRVLDLVICIMSSLRRPGTRRCVPIGA